MKKCFIMISLLLVIGLFWGCFNRPNGTVVAKVNGSYLTLEDLEHQIPEQMRSQITPEQKQDYVRQWVEIELLYQQAKKQKLQKQENVHARLRDMEKQILVDELINLEMQALGIPSDEELRNYYTENKANYRYSETEYSVQRVWHTKWAMAHKAFQEASAGEDFALVAKNYSMEPLGQENGGKIEFANRDYYGDEFWVIIEKTEKDNKITFEKASNGYYVTKLIGTHKEGEYQPFSEVKNEVLNLYLLERQQQLYNDFIQKIRVSSDVEIHEGRL